MIKYIKITNYLGESISINLQKPEESGFIIQSISGLGPAKATINFTELVTNDGAIDNSARLDTRNIVLDLIFLENPTIEATRLLTYKYFPIKQNVTFLIETDNRICETIGRVESNEPNIFDEREGTQISIMCPDPYFYSAGDHAINTTLFNGIEYEFEFPYSNESTTKNLTEFGRVVNQTEGNVYYEGDSEIGITINIHAIGDVTGIKIYNSATRDVMVIDDTKLASIVGSTMGAGDDIIINTVKGEKSITFQREGVKTNILNALARPTSWFQLTKGDNIFIYSAEKGLSNLQFQIENKIIYEGV